LMLRKPEWAVAGLIIGFLAVIASMFFVPGLPGFIWDTFTWQTGSSASHAKDWSKGFQAFFDHPWGAGLGTTDQSAVRFGIEPLTADNGYFKYAVELGIQGLVALLAIFAGILVTSYKVARYASTHNRRLMGTVVLFTTIGIMLNATTGVVFNALVLSYFYFWFAGAVVTIAQKEFTRAPEPEPVTMELSPA
ncbi:MAG TPA: hypothetical protein VFT21_10890, partial [Gemmatimonadaceae bacterium]|nr:hypothetical protein [Gemmatimonadaceae bacterium]